MPRYQEVQGELRRRIETGVYSPGSQLPPLRVLAEEFGETGTMIRHAQVGLIEDGWIEAHQGRGVWVCDPLPIVANASPAATRRALDAILVAIEALADEVRAVKNTLAA